MILSIPECSANIPAPGIFTRIVPNPIGIRSSGSNPLAAPI